MASGLCTLEEIEEKRKFAIQKLQEKRKVETEKLKLEEFWVSEGRRRMEEIRVWGHDDSALVAACEIIESGILDDTWEFDGNGDVASLNTSDIIKKDELIGGKPEDIVDDFAVDLKDGECVDKCDEGDLVAATVDSKDTNVDELQLGNNVDDKKCKQSSLKLAEPVRRSARVKKAPSK